MGKWRAGMIPWKSEDDTISSMQTNTPNRPPIPTPAADGGAGRHSTNQLSVIFHPDHLVVIQITSRPPASKASDSPIAYLPRFEALPAPTATRRADVTPPSRWGINE